MEERCAVKAARASAVRWGSGAGGGGGEGWGSIWVAEEEEVVGMLAGSRSSEVVTWSRKAVVF